LAYCLGNTNGSVKEAQESEPSMNKEILEKAIKKAIDNGLTGFWEKRYRMCQELSEMEYLTEGNLNELGKTIESLIFNHDFAKALWGDEAYHKPGMMDWAFHLQEMVIAEDPIEYLGENLDKN